MSPAHRSSARRWPVLTLVVLVLAGVALATRTASAPPQGGPPVRPGSAVGPPDAESSAWYCTGQSTATGQVAPGSLLLTNTTDRMVSGTVTSVTETGATGQTPVVVPPHSALVPLIPAPASGSWVSYEVITSGGGMAVTQAVSGSAGWSVAPCQSTTADRWYFPSGVTSGSDGLYLTLLNPTSTPDVVDLSFVTPSGTVHPINFQGIVVAPGQMAVENIAAEVQNESAVSTTVATRTGRVVATELEQFMGTANGLSTVPGLPLVERDWYLPQSQEVAGGSSQIDVFNPGTTTEDVTVRARLASGPLAPLTDRVLPGATWVLRTSAQTRIPDGAVYSAAITAAGGSGVVVGRVVEANGAAQAPQAGVANAVGALSTAPASGLWVVPPPGTSAIPAVAGVAPAMLALSNVSGSTERYAVSYTSGSASHTLASGRLVAGDAVDLASALLARAGFDQIIVRSSGPMAVSEDVGPTADTGVVTMPGLPLAAALGL
jgi:hypothetical protein